MKIENDIKLDFKDVLLRPTFLESEANLEREITFVNSELHGRGVQLCLQIWIQLVILICIDHYQNTKC